MSLWVDWCQMAHNCHRWDLYNNYATGKCCPFALIIMLNVKNVLYGYLWI